MARARILVVDDEAGMLRSMERILAPQHEVTALRVPEEAVTAARGQTFDVAVLDVRMPGMDGFDLMAALKEIQPDLDVILMTGSAHEADARLIRAIRERAFFFLTKPFDRDVLLALVSRCLELRRATTDRRTYLQRLEHELQAAQRFQTSLLPPSPLRVGRLEVRSRYLPWAQLGGDYYDVAPVRGGALLMVVDVAGHGASAAMLTGVLKLAFREGVTAGDGPAGIMARLAVCTRLFPDEGHLTAICVRIDAAGRRLEIVNAGHPPGYVVGRGGRLVRLESTAPIVHPALGDGHYESVHVTLESGDRLFLYTDGVIESRRAHDPDAGDGADSGEQFGLARLEAVLRASTPDLIEGVSERLAAFRAGRPLEDDVAMMTTEIRA